jgi:Protein of unknown function (DUF2510)
MDLGSLDFGTWRLVGLGLLSLGALATVVAIIAIIAMFRSDAAGGYPTVPKSKRVDDGYDDDGDVDHHDDDDDDDHDDEESRVSEGQGDDGDRDDMVPAAVTARERDSGPTSLPSELSSPQEGLFAVAADSSPRQPMQSTRDELHVPSPDWYDYSEADSKAAVEHDDHVANTALDEVTRQPDQPVTPPPAPSPGTGPQQSVGAEGRESRRPSRWFDDSATSDETSQAASSRQPDTAAAPVAFPWEQRQEARSATPERPVAPVRDEPRRPTADRDDVRSTGIVDGESGTPSRRLDPRPAAPSGPVPTSPERQAPLRPTAGPTDTGTSEAVPSAAPTNPPVRQDPDAPTADWYDDPDGSGGERWWDGKSWTRHRRSRPGSPTTTDTGRQRAVAARPQADPPAAAIRRRAALSPDDGETQGGQSSSRAPGWYRDPSGSAGRRFWDGSHWTNGT